MAAPITADSLCIAALKNAGWAEQPLASLVIYLHINTEHIPVLRGLMVVVIVTSMCHYKRLCNTSPGSHFPDSGQGREFIYKVQNLDWI